MKSERIFEHYCFHPFMILAFKATEKGKKALSQTLHIDYTGRVQSVTKQSNEKYYNLKKAFAKITNIPALLNTSFNDAEEPLVNTPRQALKTFFGSGMDMLAIGDYIVKKRR
jgi:carbamoyltransferase